MTTRAEPPRTTAQEADAGASPASTAEAPGTDRPPTQSRLDPARIVVVAGMQKSGTGWYYNLVNDLIEAGGGHNARQVREKHNLWKLLGKWHTPGLARPFFWRVRPLEALRRQGYSFAFKTHKPPRWLMRRYMDQRKFRAVYIYRDLRDVVVSAYDHGVKSRANGNLPIRGFARLTSINRTIGWVCLHLIPVWKIYTGRDDVLVVRYEDLKADTEGVLRRTADFLELTVSDEKIGEICDAYQPDRVKADKVRKTLHLNKAIVGRYRKSLTPEQIAKCNRRFGRYLEKMGYETDEPAPETQDAPPQESDFGADAGAEPRS